MQPFPRPNFDARWQAGPIDLSPVPEGVKPYDWDPDLGLSRRFIPGQPGGMHTLTGLSHDERSKVAYDPESHERGCAMRSRKIAVLQQTLKPPEIYGDPSGDLLVVAWGSTKGAIEEAVDRLRAEGHRVSSIHLRFLSPLEPGLKDIFSRFKKVITVEINYTSLPRIAGTGNSRGCCAPAPWWMSIVGLVCRANRSDPRVLKRESRACCPGGNDDSGVLLAAGLRYR